MISLPVFTTDPLSGFAVLIAVSPSSISTGVTVLSVSAFALSATASATLGISLFAKDASLNTTS